MIEQVLTLGDKKFRLTWHVLSRALDMGIGGSEIVDTLRNPQTIVPSKKYENCHNYHGERFSLGTQLKDDGVISVITVLWNTEDAWREDIELGGYYDRELREDYDGPRLT